MNTLDIDAMREHLKQFTTDTSFIEQTLRRLGAPPKRKVQMIPAEPSRSNAKTYEQLMEESSEKMAKAIELHRAGHDPRTTAKLIWRFSTGADMPNWSGEREIIERVYPAPINRDPCSYCGTRRDIGCKHTKVNS